MLVVVSGETGQREPVRGKRRHPCEDTTHSSNFGWIDRRRGVDGGKDADRSLPAQWHDQAASNDVASCWRLSQAINQGRRQRPIDDHIHEHAAYCAASLPLGPVAIWRVNSLILWRCTATRRRVDNFVEKSRSTSPGNARKRTRHVGVPSHGTVMLNKISWLRRKIGLWSGDTHEDPHKIRRA